MDNLVATCNSASSSKKLTLGVMFDVGKSCVVNIRLKERESDRNRTEMYPTRKERMLESYIKCG